MEKTNVMRLLDAKKIDYQSYTYDSKEAISGVEVANFLHEDANKVFKTLVTISDKNNYYVFLVPVAKELDLKKAAKSVNEKSIAMLKQQNLEPLTGYVHGGCSPIGMKKTFKTTIDISASSHETIIFSAGKIGYQVELSLESLTKILDYHLADIIKEDL